MSRLSGYRSGWPSSSLSCAPCGAQSDPLPTDPGAAAPGSVRKIHQIHEILILAERYSRARRIAPSTLSRCGNQSGSWLDRCAAPLGVRHGGTRYARSRLRRVLSVPRSPRKGVLRTIALRALAVFLLACATLLGSVAYAALPPSPSVTDQTGFRQVTLTWAGVLATPPVQKYQVRYYHASISEAVWEDVPGGAGARSHTVTGLADNRLYVFHVRAVNADGNGQSTESVVKTLTPVVATPSGFTATGGLRELDLSWTAAASGVTVERYQYRLSTDELSGNLLAGGAFFNRMNTWIDIPGSDNSTTSYTITGLVDSTAYTVELRIRAASLRSDAATATATTDTLSSGYTGPPGTPRNLVAGLTHGCGVTITWDAPLSDGGSDITKYEFQRNGGGWKNRSEFGSSNINNDPSKMSGLGTCGTTHTVEFRAVNANGAGPAVSVTFRLQTVGRPDAITDLTAVGGYNSIRLEWTRPWNNLRQISKYQYRYKLNSATRWGNWTDMEREKVVYVLQPGIPLLISTGSHPPDTYYNLTGLSDSTTYDVQVRAVNPEGAGPENTNRARATTQDSNSPPAAPTGFTVTAEVWGFDLSWDLAAPGLGEFSYQFRWNRVRGDHSISDWTRWIDIPGSDSETTKYRTIGLFSGSLYTVELRIRAGTVYSAAATDTAQLLFSPFAPVNLEASPGIKSIMLDWETPNDGGGAITEYEYRYKLSSDTSWDTITWTNIPDSGPETIEFTKTGLDDDTSYDFELRAVNEHGNGRVEAVTGQTAGPPRAPSLRAQYPLIESIRFFWYIPDDGGSAITKYEYRYKLSSVTSWGTITWTDIPDSGPETIEFTKTGLLSNGTSYDFELRAVNMVGNGHVESFTGRTAGPPGAPLGLVALSHIDSITLSWRTPAAGLLPITKYEYRYKLSSVTSWGTITWTEVLDSGSETTSVTVTGLAISTSYDFELRAVNELGTGLEASVSGRTQDPPPAPYVYHWKNMDGAVTLIWVTLDQNDDYPILKYQYRQASDQSTPDEIWNPWEDWTDIPDSGLEATKDMNNDVYAEYTVRGLTNGTLYRLEVRAVSSVGPGPPSNEAYAFPGFPPSAPTALTVVENDRSVTLHWEPPADPGSYPVFGYLVSVYRDGKGVTGAEWFSETPPYDQPPIDGITFEDLTNNTLHTFEVYALTVWGDGPKARVTATPQVIRPPGEPRSMTLNSGDGKVIAQWFPPRLGGGRPILRYEYCLELIWRCNDDNLWIEIPDSAPGRANHGRYDIARPNGTYTTVYLRAVNNQGAGPDVHRGTMPFAGAPGPPGDFSAEFISQNEFRLSWTEPAAAPGVTITGYIIDKSPDGVNDWEQRIYTIAELGTTSTLGRIGLREVSRHVFELQTAYFRIRTLFRVAEAVVVDGLSLSEGMSETSPPVRVNPATGITSAALSSDPGDDGVYAIGDVIRATVTFSSPVTVVDESVGAPFLFLELGSGTVPAPYESGSGTESLVFAYTVAENDEDSDGVAITENGLRSGAGIEDASEAKAFLTHDAAPADAGHRVDGMRPTLLSAMRSTGGETFILTFSEPIASVVLTSFTLATANGAPLESPIEAVISGATVELTPPATLDINLVGSIQVVAIGARDLAGNGNATTTVELSEAALPELNILFGGAEGTEGPGATVDFTVRLNPASTGTVTVDYETQDNATATATAGSDYIETSGTLTFLPGETEKTVSVPIIDDTVEDDGEAFTLVLTNPTGARLGGGIVGIGIIRNTEDEPTTPPDTLTASFTESRFASRLHKGSDDRPQVVVAFSEAVETIAADTLSVTVTGGMIASVRAHTEDGLSNAWIFFLTPDGDGDVTFALAAGAACDNGGICSAGGTTLTEVPAALTIPGPGAATEAQDSAEAVNTPPEEEPEPEPDPLPPLTASFEGVPAEHDGSTVFTFQLRFSEDPAVSYKVLRDDAFSVSSGGLVDKARRVNGRDDLREIHIQPLGHGPIAIHLPGSADCNAAAAICTADGRPLSNSSAATVRGLAALSVADAQVTEAAGATVDFVVSLSRAASGPVTVEYATADGSATAGADYTSATGVLTFSAGQTTKTVPVTVLDDVHDDDGETFTLRLSNAAGARIADSEATGTIENADPLPKGWLSRFGRTSAVQVVGLLDARFDEARAPSQLTLGGRSVTMPAPGGHRRDNTDPADEPVGPGAGAAATDAARGRAALNNDPAALHTDPFAALAFRHTPADAARGRADLDNDPAARDTDPFAALASRHTPADAARGRADLDNDPAALHADLSAVPDPSMPAVGAGSEATLLERLAWGLLTRSDWSIDRRQFLSRSSFNLSLSGQDGASDGAALETARVLETPGHWSMWGRGALTRFGGIDDGVSLDGDVLTGLLGLDYARDRWLAGVALAYNDGDGTYRASDSGAAGALDSTLVSVHPYLRYALTDRLSAWGALGYGQGTLTLRPARVTAAGDGLKSVPGDSGVSEGSGESDPMETGMQMRMGALGLRGTLFASATTELALKSDLLWVRTASEATDGLQAVDGAAASRVRLLLSGRHRHALAAGGELTPSFELGLRYDDGDAETGLGVELGGGLHYTDPALGLTVETRARALLAHEDGGYEEWGLSGSLQLDPGRLGRGLSLRLDSGWGATASGAEALWQRQSTAGLARQHDAPAQGRITAEMGYGLDVPYSYGLLTPYGSVELAGGGSRTTRLGWRFELGQRLSLSLAGDRRETAHARPEHGLMLRGSLPW